MDSAQHDLIRDLPSVDRLLREPALQTAITQIGREAVADLVRDTVDQTRQHLLDTEGLTMNAAQLHQQVLEGIVAAVSLLQTPAYRRVVNATGIILHTGLGRAVIATSALKQVQEQLNGYSLLQLDAEGGKRSRRDAAIEQLLQKLTGAEAATVVNNNAAATAIVLNTVASGNEVIVSRGQLVEIGGAFRLPDVMAFSGAKLVEVGTTNKTHARDYLKAITEETAAILRVHPSNYKIQGFSSEVPLEDLVKIAHDHNLPLIDDVGAGSLVDLSPFGLEPEPTLQESIAAGSDLVTSSADKLIGASQGGIILGRQFWIEAIRKNQFARIVRVDKLTLAVLEATLKLFLDQAKALIEVPTLRMIVTPAEALAELAEAMVTALNEQSYAANIQAVPAASQTGSGSLPTQNLPTTCVAIMPQNMSAESLSANLRRFDPPIFTRIQNDQVLLDPRTLQPGDAKIIMEALTFLLS